MVEKTKSIVKYINTIGSTAKANISCLPHLSQSLPKKINGCFANASQYHDKLHCT